MVVAEDIAVILLAAAILLVSIIGIRANHVNNLEKLASVALLAESPLLLFLVIGEVFGVVPVGYAIGSLVVVLITVVVGGAAYAHGRYIEGRSVA